MKMNLLIFCFLFFLTKIDPTHSVFIKSELDAQDERIQHVTVYFSEGRVSKENIKSIFNENFTKNTQQGKGIYMDGVPNHIGGLFQEINQEKLSDKLAYLIGYSIPCLHYLDNIKHVSFNFQNISTEGQLSLLSNFMDKAVSVLSDIYDDQPMRVKEIDIKYAYWNESSSDINRIFNHGRVGWSDGAERKKDTFEAWIKEFKERKQKIRAKK